MKYLQLLDFKCTVNIFNRNNFIITLQLKSTKTKTGISNIHYGLINVRTRFIFCAIWIFVGYHNMQKFNFTCISAGYVGYLIFSGFPKYSLKCRKLRRVYTNNESRQVTLVCLTVCNFIQFQIVVAVIIFNLLRNYSTIWRIL